MSIGGSKSHLWSFFTDTLKAPSIHYVHVRAKSNQFFHPVQEFINLYISFFSSCRDHMKVFVGDERGRVFSWSVADQPGKVITDHWVKDESSDTCTSCNTKFTFSERRHHCRNCGKLFCSRLNFVFCCQKWMHQYVIKKFIPALSKFKCHISRTLSLLWETRISLSTTLRVAFVAVIIADSWRRFGKLVFIHEFFISVILDQLSY